jgi:uncharacterized protein (TIGR02284 family)
MSTDESVTKDLIETLEDGKNGFAFGAEKLENDGRADLAATFRRYSEQRAKFSAELRELARHYGDHIEEDGSLAAKLHRGWMSIKDAVAGTDPSGVLDVAEQGEDHAVAAYEWALAEDDISPKLRSVIERQFADVRAAHDDVKSLRASQD